MPACSEWDPFPSRAKKTSPLYSPNPSLGCGQPAPPLQRWRLRNTVLEQEGNVFSHRETCPQFGSAGKQHCIDWGCGGAARREWRGTCFSLGTDSGAMVLHCYLRACVVWSMDAGKSYRWARHTRTKKQAMTTMAFDTHRGAGPAFTPGQDRNVLLLLQPFP